MLPPSDVAKDSSNAIASSPDLECAPTAAESRDGTSNTFPCTESEIAPSASHDMLSFVTATSSDDSATEATTTSTEDQAVHEGSVAPIVHSPSKSNSGASGAFRRDKTVECSTGISPANSSEGSTTVVAKAVLHDMIPAPVSTRVAQIVHHPVPGMVHTTGKDSAVPSRAMPLSLSIAEVGGIMNKHIQGVSMVAPPGEVNAEQKALTKKRKSEYQSSKKKQANDPDAPKKNLTAYMHYSNYARNYFKANQPHLIKTNLTNVVQRGWNAMSAQERHYWEEIAAADKERYQEDLAAYKNRPSDSNSGANPVRKRRTKKAKDPNAPKRNVSAYMHYSSSARADVKKSQPELSFVEITKVVSARWNSLSDQERAVWNGKAAIDKERYKTEQARYASQVEESMKLQFLQIPK